MTGEPLTARARVALRLVGLLAVVVGVIGMHGLANHGVTGMEAMGPPSVATTVTSAITAAETTAGAVRAEVVASAAPILPPGMDMNMAGWCIAILMLGVGAVSMLLRGNGLTLAPWVLPLAVRTVHRYGRDPDPPSLRRLSIQRC